VNPAAVIVEAAQKCLGIPYVFGGRTPAQGFDCEGLTQWCCGRAGITIPAGSAAQFTESGPAVKSLLPGDLVFFAGGEPVGPRPGHVGIFTGRNAAGLVMIDAPYSGQVVRYDNFSPTLGVGPLDFWGATRPAALLAPAQPTEVPDMYLVTLATGNPTEPIYLLTGGVKYHLSPEELSVYKALGMTVQVLPVSQAPGLAAIPGLQ
jgi:cell wall-associated NlpC family hydrolase